jgi:hypothetical protein
MWIRFETRYRNANSRWATGVFQYISSIAEDKTLDSGLRASVQILREWFNKNLPAPPKSKINPKSIFWFKLQPDLSKPARVSPWKRRPLTKLAARVSKRTIPSDRPIDQPHAVESIEKLKELLRLMESAGYRTRTIATEHPGYITYEDLYQIAAIPFKDAFEEHYLDDWLDE